jgi:hypothetical protein
MEHQETVMIRPLEGTSPPFDPTPQQPPASQKRAKTKPPTAIAADTAKLSRIASAPKTLSLKSPPDSDVRKLINDADTNVLLMTDGIPTEDMIKLLSKAAKRDVAVEVRFDVKPNETDVTRTFREAASVKLREADVKVTWGHTAVGVEGPPNATTASGKLWVDYKTH